MLANSRFPLSRRARRLSAPSSVSKKGTGSEPDFERARKTRSREVPVLRFRSRGFTLIELLVVIAIIAVLIALMLPAVQQVRETARKAECRNRLMHLGLALHNYEMAFEVLPPGVSNPTGPIKNLPEGYHVGWLLRILPYLDQNVVARNFDFSRSVYDPRQDAVRGVALPTFYCPSMMGDSMQSQQSADRKAVGITSFVGCSHHTEAPIDADNSGVLFLNSHVAYEDITDGAANTLFVGEKRHQPNDLGWASGTRGTLRNASSVNEMLGKRPVVPNPSLPRAAVGAAATGRPGSQDAEEQDASPKSTTVDPLAVGGFGSHHVGGAHFLMGDGTVRFISEYVDSTLFSNLGNRADGQLPADF